SAIYDADTAVRVKFSFIRLWSTPDPWTGTSTGDMLDELQAYWQANEGFTPRDITHLVSGRSSGGLAYLDVLCDTTYGYGVSAGHGEFNVMARHAHWERVVG